MMSSFYNSFYSFAGREVMGAQVLKK